MTFRVNICSMRNETRTADKTPDGVATGGRWRSEKKIHISKRDRVDSVAPNLVFRGGGGFWRGEHRKNTPIRHFTDAIKRQY